MKDSAGRRALFAAGAAAPTVALGMASFEALFRLLDPPPRVVLVRASTVRDFHVDGDGVPLWDFSPPGNERLPNCPTRNPGARIVLMVGSSITYGSGVGRDQTVSAQLEAALEDPAICVENQASPGFDLDQQLATTPWGGMWPSSAS